MNDFAELGFARVHRPVAPDLYLGFVGYQVSGPLPGDKIVRGVRDDQQVAHSVSFLANQVWRLPMIINFFKDCVLVLLGKRKRMASKECDILAVPSLIEKHEFFEDFLGQVDLPAGALESEVLGIQHHNRSDDFSII